MMKEEFKISNKPTSDMAATRWVAVSERGEDDMQKCKWSIRMGRKELEGLFQKLQIYWDVKTQPALGFTENSP